MNDVATNAQISPVPAHVPDTRGQNLYHADPVLPALLRLYLTPALLAHVEPRLAELGALAGGKLDALAGTADRNPPKLHHRDRTGVDAQWIEKHPAYAEMERLAFAEYGLAAMSHRPGVFGWPEALPPAVKYAFSYLFVQAEFGLCCPVSMTDALARTLAKFGGAELAGRYLPGLTATDMDAHLQGAMFMTRMSGPPRRLRAPAATTGCSPATNGSAPTPMPTSRWCWRGRKMRVLAPRGWGCSCCRGISKTARPITFASCA